MENQIDFTQIQFRLDNIRKKAASSINLNSGISKEYYQDFFSSSILNNLEDIDAKYQLNPYDLEIPYLRPVYAYDESISIFRALEGELVFVSSACISVDEEEYTYNLRVKPFFVTAMKKFYRKLEEGIIFSDRPAETRKMNILEEKISSIEETVSPNSIILIDGPMIAGNISSYMIGMDERLREKNCIPIYFVKNSDSRMIIDNMPHLTRDYNSDFHWAHENIPVGHRSSFFKYDDADNPRNSKIFSYIKPVPGFPQRIELHSKTYYKHQNEIEDIFNLISYYYLAQKTSNPQVRPIAVAEKYAREGIKVLNIPQLLLRIGFHPSLNQVRFR
ncbi:MAG: hypothetical protein ACTSW1_09125 [Candidatus Hodarchaeales archaeon]